MYKSFYNLNKKPFQISSDPSFMWFGEKHKEALATLKYGILDNKGFLLLTGDVGTGKTSLINALLESLSDDIICTSVPDPGLEKLDFFNYISAGFGINKEFTTKGTFLAHFRKFLLDANDNNKKVLLIIDEAQLLTQEMLEETRLLSNIEKTDAKLINIFFVGQNEFNDILNRDQNRAVRQRLTLNYNIDPLTPDETNQYIKHRLSVAGATFEIFDASATQEVFLYSGGFPRRINVICDHSLLSGYVKEQKIINAAIVKECAKELKIPAHIKNRDINGFADYQENKASVVTPQPHHSQSGKVEKEKKKSGYKYFLTGIVCFFIIFLCGFFLYPTGFTDSFSLLHENVMIFKDKLLQEIPEPYASYLKKEILPDENKRDVYSSGSSSEKHDIPGSDDRIKTDEKKILSEPEQIKKTIYPIQEGLLKTEIVQHPIQPIDTADKEAVKPSKNNTENSTNSVDTSHLFLSDSQQTSLKKTLDDKNGIKIQKEIEPLPLPKEKVIVRFKYNSNDFTEEGYKNMLKFADVLATHPDVKILISGYTDSEGYQKYNKRLSEFRANIVGSFFLGKGIKQDQILTEGLGSQNPLENNETAWGRMMNRRVEIEIIQEKKAVETKQAQ